MKLIGEGIQGLVRIQCAEICLSYRCECVSISLRYSNEAFSYVKGNEQMLRIVRLTQLHSKIFKPYRAASKHGGTSPDMFKRG